MKVNYFYGSIAIVSKDDYTENLEFSVDKTSGKLEFRYPYGQITPEQAEAVSQFVKTVTDAYKMLQFQINGVNKRLKLEEYAEKCNEGIENKEVEVSTEVKEEE